MFSENDYQELARKFEEVNLNKSQFISTLSHEFRTFITAISMNLQMLEMYDAKWPPEKKQTVFRRLDSTIKVMIALLDAVTILTKDIDGKLQAVFSEFDLPAYCMETAEKLNKLKEYKSDIEYTTDGSVVQVVTDSSLLAQVLGNLLNNALKFSPEGGPVVLDLRMKDPENVLLTVSDKGIGIPEDELDRVFIPFRRAENALGFPGSGLGLSTAKSCLNLLKGTIKIESKENLGTTIYVELPLRPDIK